MESKVFFFFLFKFQLGQLKQKVRDVERNQTQVIAEYERQLTALRDEVLRMRKVQNHLLYWLNINHQLCKTYYILRWPSNKNGTCLKSKSGVAAVLTIIPLGPKF